MLTLCPPVIVVLTNREDSVALLLEAERQGLMNGDYVFLLVQHFEVSEGVVSKIFFIFKLQPQLHAYLFEWHADNPTEEMK